MIHKSRFALLASSFLFALLLLLVVVVDLGHGSISGGISVCDAGCDYATIQDALAHAQAGDEIKVAPGIYSETLTISQSLTLLGEGSGMTVIDGHSTGTVISITAGTRVTISGMTISNGLAQLQGADSYGGGIYNLGHLSLIDSEITRNRAEGMVASQEGELPGDAYGGGIYNGCGPALCATLVLSNTMVHRNTVYGGDDDYLYTDRGGNVQGGGLYNGCANESCGRVTLEKSVIANNEIWAGNPGGEAEGGGIYNLGVITIEKSEVANNGSRGGFLGGGAGGGGIYNSGTLTITDTLIDRNGAFGGFIPGPFSPDGYGGGILSLGQLSIEGSTISDNGSSAEGGGLANGNNGTVQMVNNTISSNESRFGGGISNYGIIDLESVTIYQNHANPGSRSAGVGGGIINSRSAGIAVHNTLIAGNMAYEHPYFGLPSYGPDCAGTLISQGYNLLGNSDECTLAGLSDGNLVGRPAVLNPLGDYGGPTPTHAPWFASPVLDAGDPLNCPAVDQRGAPRPGESGNQKHCDIGAVEGDVPPASMFSMPLMFSN